ncbi:TPA: hypothetical protein HA238_02555 [Candidatus Micrarchaeota archaeon]|nr:hypothetical protein [Candidatus Micrarchaeota archaeon]
MTHREQPRGLSRNYTVVDLVRELARKLMKPELEEYMTGGVYRSQASNLAYDSQHGDFGHSALPTIQRSISALRGETVEGRAQELLEALRKQFHVDAEFTIRLLRVVASNERARAMEHTEHAATCNGLADAIIGKQPKPKELNSQKLGLFYELCIEILSTPQTWAEPTEEGCIILSEEKAAGLRGLIQDRLGINGKDASDLLNTLRVACEGLWRVDIEHEIQGYLQQIVNSIQECGQCSLGFGEGSATRDDLVWLDSHGGRGLKPEKELEFRRNYVRTSLLEGASDPSKIFEAAFPYVHYTIRAEATRLEFFAEEQPQAQEPASGGSERDGPQPATTREALGFKSYLMDSIRRVRGLPEEPPAGDTVVLRPRETRLPDVPAPKELRKDRLENKEV